METKEIVAWSLAFGLLMELLRWVCNIELRKMETRNEARKLEKR